MNIEANLPVEKRQVTFNNVRANWLDLFKARVPQGSETGAARFGATLMADPKEHKKPLAKVGKIIAHLVEKVLEMDLEDIERSKMPLKKPRKVDIEKQPAYKGLMLLPAYSPEKDPVQVVDGNMKLLSEGSPIPYNGCRCNIVVELYVTKNRPDSVFCSLVAVQFAGDDEPLGGGAKPKADELFKKLPDSDDDFDEDEEEDGDDDDI